MLQKSFLEKVEDRIKADNGVDNILDLYERTLQHSTATGTITVHGQITKIPSNLRIVPERIVLKAVSSRRATKKEERRNSRYKTFKK